MTTTWITRSMVAVMAISAIGCGQGFKTGNKSASNGVQAVDVSDQLAKAQAAAKAAEVAMTEADAAVAQMTDKNGNINVSLFTKSSTNSVQTQGLLAPLLAKLQPIFDKVLSKVTVVEAQFTTARGLLADALGKLNPNDPVQAQLIQKIKDQMAQIDLMEQKFKDGIHMLASKLTLVIVGLDNIVNKVTAFIPGFGWLASLALDMLVMQDVKDIILAFQQKLMMV